MFLPLPEYRRRCDLSFEGTESMTKQSHKDECDIHKILNQFQKTGIINHISPNQPRYLDLPDSFDYQSAINLVLDAQEAFATLDASVRDRYGNDPERFLAAIQDPTQREYLESVGVFEKKKPPPAPMKVEVVNPVAPQA